VTTSGVLSLAGADIQWEYSNLLSASDGWTHISPIDDIRRYCSSPEGKSQNLMHTIRSTDELYRSDNSKSEKSCVLSDGKWDITISSAGIERKATWTAISAERNIVGTIYVSQRDREFHAFVRSNDESARRKLFRLLFLTRLVISKNWAIVHGALLVRNGRTVLLIGQSGFGKSTLSLASTMAGWQVLAEDSVYVDQLLHGYPLFPSGRWECRICLDEFINAGLMRDVMAKYVTFPRDHRQRVTLFPENESDFPFGSNETKYLIDHVIYLHASVGRASPAEERVATIMKDAISQRSFRLVCDLSSLNYDHAIEATSSAARQLVYELPYSDFGRSGNLTSDVARFNRLLEEASNT
jgi:hypothetical protein